MQNGQAVATTSAPEAKDLVGAVVVHARADLLFHRHPPTARAAAEAVFASALLLHPAGSAQRQRVEHARGASYSPFQRPR